MRSIRLIQKIVCMDFKVIGVTNFFLFVEGKAATPGVSKVLESIAKVKLIHRTKELEEQQAKSPDLLIFSI
ncbi:hypothetical protein L6452_31837 [Arctium lappa]|uniref:Uncharacterized protein n=1 Tax=Arctium lappa TaxID=4217 RepID=A0ACB8Z2W9_ARCLA|nr:hypothetical protein L6452_31837 [Arctium lappa]